jgi:chromosome segregation ATPase
MTNEKLDVHDMFVAQLTHSAYFVQTLRIEPSFNTRLEKLLATFEQNNFLGEDETIKRFPFETDENEVSEIKELLGILQYMAADKKTREELDLENRYLKEMEWDFGEQNRELEKTKKALDEQAKTLDEQAKTLKEQANTIAEKDARIAKERQNAEKEISEKDNALQNALARIAELERLAELKETTQTHNS